MPNTHTGAGYSGPDRRTNRREPEIDFKADFAADAAAMETYDGPKTLGQLPPEQRYILDEQDYPQFIDFQGQQYEYQASPPGDAYGFYKMVNPITQESDIPYLKIDQDGKIFMLEKK